MKTLIALALIPCSVLPIACTQTVATHGDSALKMTNFASRTKAGKIRIGGENGIAIDNWDDDATQVASVFLKEAAKAWRNYMALQGIKYLSDKYYDSKNNELTARSTENLEKLRNAKSAQDQAHALDVLKATPPETATGTVLTVPAT